MHTGKRYTPFEFAKWTKRDTLLMLLIATIPTVLYVIGWKFIGLPWQPVAIVGTAVAFIVGFKNNASYNWGGEHWFKATEDSPGHWGGTKACVKGYQGTAYESYTCYDSSGDSSSSSVCYRPVRVYEQVKWQQYQSRRAIDVFINGKNWTRVHW